MDIENTRTTPEQRTYIKTLFAKNGNAITSELLVKAAQAQDSPIHDLFTWDNRRAGHLYRLREAARILRSYTGWLPSVIKGKKKESVPGFQIPMAVKVRPAPDEPFKNVQTANALEDEFMRRQVIIARIDGVKRSIKQLLIVPELKKLYAQLLEAIDSYPISSMMENFSDKNEVRSTKKELAHVRK